MENTLYFGGCNVAELARTYGTPLYVISAGDVKDRCRELREEFTEKYPDTYAAYASKAFQTIDMLRIVRDEGLHLDIVSGGELYAALKAGFDPAKIGFHGNTKDEEELRFALESEVGKIIVDNISELELLNELALEYGKVQQVLLRVTPGVDSHTHQYISTGQIDSKFGISVDETIEKVAGMALEMEGIKLRGIHFHVGSQLHENDSHLMAVEIILKMLAELKEKYGWVPEEINCGGGFGIHYAGDPERTKVSFFMDPVMEMINAFYKEAGDKRPEVSIEPGRWVIGEAGLTVYEIGSTKTNAAGRFYAGINGGFPDNPRTALYEAQYEAEAVEKINEPHDVKTTVAGKCCESGDVLIYDIMLPELKRGDLLAVFSTGAYNYTMASNYNRVPRPAVVMVENGEARLSVRRETYADLIERELNAEL